MYITFLYRHIAANKECETGQILSFISFHFYLFIFYFSQICFSHTRATSAFVSFLLPRLTKYWLSGDIPTKVSLVLHVFTVRKVFLFVTRFIWVTMKQAFICCTFLVTFLPSFCKPSYYMPACLSWSIISYDFFQVSYFRRR